MPRSLPSACILLDASFVLAISRGLHEFATADFFNDAPAKPLANQFPNTDFLDRLAKGETRLVQPLARAAGPTGVLDGRLTHCIQIVTFFPAPINFLPDAMVLASIYMRPPQTTACLRLAWFAVWTKAL
jgi:hypothetical protein